MEGIILYVLIGLAVVVLWMFFYFVPVGLWISALAAGVPIGPGSFIGMRLRRVNPHRLILPMIAAWKAGLELSSSDLEAHFLAGGDVERLVRALISADKAGIDLAFQRAAAIALAGRDVFDAVAMSVNPRVIETPKIAAVAKDGIELLAVAKITVRANIERLVGGATEATVIARVGEGIVSAIGSADTHKAVLENPDSISKLVLSKGLDAGTAFELLSIDIADVDVGRNIGAELQTAQAQADLQVARARAEERRAMAIAREQEMLALVQERRAAVVAAEAEIPQAIAEAFRKGQLGIMDYYRMQNIQADTQMREGLGKPEAKPRGSEEPPAEKGKR
jgi:uncharacterized protein YqfA (UPF0365 family)